MGVIPKSLVLWVSLAMEVCIVIIYADMNKQCFSGEWNLLIETNKFVYCSVLLRDTYHGKFQPVKCISKYKAWKNRNSLYGSCLLHIPLFVNKSYIPNIKFKDLIKLLTRYQKGNFSSRAFTQLKNTKDSLMYFLLSSKGIWETDQPVLVFSCFSFLFYWWKMY